MPSLARLNNLVERKDEELVNQGLNGRGSRQVETGWAEAWSAVPLKIRRLGALRDCLQPRQAIVLDPESRG